jgi:hypothetical protein
MVTPPISTSSVASREVAVSTMVKYRSGSSTARGVFPGNSLVSGLFHGLVQGRGLRG